MKRNKRQIISLCGGCLWLFAVSTAFAVSSLVWIATPLARAILVGVLAVIALCVGLNIHVLRAAIRMPGTAPPLTPDDRTRLQQFRNVTIAEVVGCAGVSWLCILTHHVSYLAAANVAIVGLHFVPLARIFAVPRYLPMGISMCVISLITFAAVPPRTLVGHALALFVVPSLLCAAVVIPTALAGVREAWISTKTLPVTVG